MSDSDVRKAALADPDAAFLSKAQLSRMRRISRVKALRERMGLTQREFAEAFHLPLTTLRDWEQRRSVPDAPARALLRSMSNRPSMRRTASSARGETMAGFSPFASARASPGRLGRQDVVRVSRSDRCTHWGWMLLLRRRHVLHASAQFDKTAGPKPCVEQVIVVPRGSIDEFSCDRAAQLRYRN